MLIRAPAFVLGYHKLLNEKIPTTKSKKYNFFLSCLFNVASLVATQCGVIELQQLVMQTQTIPRIDFVSITLHHPNSISCWRFEEASCSLAHPRRGGGSTHINKMITYTYTYAHEGKHTRKRSGTHRRNIYTEILASSIRV